MQILIEFVAKVITEKFTRVEAWCVLTNLQLKLLNSYKIHLNLKLMFARFFIYHITKIQYLKPYQ